jgi:hypothetical protein
MCTNVYKHAHAVQNWFSVLRNSDGEILIVQNLDDYWYIGASGKRIWMTIVTIVLLASVSVVSSSEVCENLCMWLSDVVCCYLSQVFGGCWVSVCGFSLCFGMFLFFSVEQRPWIVSHLTDSHSFSLLPSPLCDLSLFSLSCFSLPHSLFNLSFCLSQHHTHTHSFSTHSFSHWVVQTSS